jgi:hypothetical protein
MRYKMAKDFQLYSENPVRGSLCYKMFLTDNNEIKIVSPDGEEISMPIRSWFYRAVASKENNYDSIHSLIMSPRIASAIKTTPKDNLHPVLYCKNIVVSEYMSDKVIVCLDERGNCVKEFVVEEVIK